MIYIYLLLVALIVFWGLYEVFDDAHYDKNEFDRIIREWEHELSN